MRVIEADVVVIGAGGAGLRAAIAIAEQDPSLDVALVSKVYPMRSHTVAAEGGAAGVVQAPDTLDDHFMDTVSGGDWLCDQDAVEMFVAEAPNALAELERWGCPWSRNADGTVAVRSFGGMKNRRTWFAADKSGFHILHTLFQTSLRFPSIHRFDEYFALDLLVDQGAVIGLTAIAIESGEFTVFVAPAVIIATGGAGRVFPFTTNGAIKTGDGMAMAYRAGVPLKDMEFVQYHPTGLPGTGILITEGARGEGGILVNRDGYRSRTTASARRTRGHGARRWNSGRAIGSVRRSGTSSAKAGRSLARPAMSYTSTSAIWARPGSTSACHSCANWHAHMSASIRCMPRSRCGRWSTTPWAASILT